MAGENSRHEAFNGTKSRGEAARMPAKWAKSGKKAKVLSLAKNCIKVGPEQSKSEAWGPIFIE